MEGRGNAVIETFVNPQLERPYVISCETTEFTCLCPRTGQPDFATVRLQYVPDQRCVELRSLKRYLWGYRTRGVFHEAVCNQILNDLVQQLSPHWMRITLRFNIRGGIATTVTTQHGVCPQDAKEITTSQHKLE
ncbi:MAG: NADPH-dependent 7-cyano-7-deazaguanine reductase QueF [Deltaproteobacteria bacterium]|nr:NADPH-dependent 7-cyano-7-deazaguanine reductase QueF [Deltaproteobacteria bacterium]